MVQQNPTPENERNEGAEQARELHVPFANNQAEQFHKEVNESMNQMPPVTALDAKLKHMEDVLFKNTTFPRAEVTAAVRRAITPLMDPAIVGAYPADMSMDRLLRNFVFHVPGVETNHELYVNRIAFLQEFLNNNVYLVEAQPGKQREAMEAARSYNKLDQTYRTKYDKDLYYVVPDDYGDDIKGKSMFLPEPVLLYREVADVESLLAPGINEEGKVDPNKSDVKVPFKVRSFRVDLRTLYKRQAIEHAFSHPRQTKDVGPELSQLSSASSIISDDAKILELPVDDTPAAMEEALAANAHLGYSPDKLKVEMEKAIAARRVEEFFRDPTHGARRKEVVENAVLLDQAHKLLPEFEAYNPELAADIKHILDGAAEGDKFRNKDHRKNIKSMQEVLKKIENNQAPRQSLFERPETEGLMKMHFGTPNATVEGWSNRLYDLINFVEVEKTRSPDKFAAVQKILAINTDTDEIPADIDEQTIKDANDFIEFVEQDGQRVFDILEEMRRSYNKDREAIAQGFHDVALEHNSTAQVVHLISLIKNAGFNYASYPASLKETIDKMYLLKPGAWQTDPAAFETLMSTTLRYQQTLLLLKDVRDNFCDHGVNPEALMDRNVDRTLFEFDKMCLPEERRRYKTAVDNYLAKAPQAREYWEIESIRDRIDEELEKVREQQRVERENERALAELREKERALEVLKRRMGMGYLNMELLEKIIASANAAAEPGLIFEDKIQEAFKTLVEESVSETASKYAQDMLYGNMKPGQDPETKDNFLSNRGLENEGALRDFLDEKEAGEVQEALDELSNGLLFKDLAEAQKFLDDNLAKLREKFPNAPKEFLLESGTWIYVSGDYERKSKKKGKKKAKTTSSKGTFYAEIAKATDGGITLDTGNGPSTPVPLEQFVFHALNSVLDPTAKVRLNHLHNNNKKDDPDQPNVVTQEDLLKHSTLEENSCDVNNIIRMGSDNFGKIIKKGKVRGRPGVFIEYKLTDDDKAPSTDFISYTQLYLMDKYPPDSKTKLTIVRGSPQEKTHRKSSSFNILSLAGAFEIGKGIFDYKKHQLEEWRELRRKYEMLYWFEEQGGNLWNKSSIWQKVKSDIEGLEESTTKNYKNKLDNMQSSQLKDFIRKEMRRFDHVDMNVASSGNRMTDFWAGIVPGIHAPMFEERAEFKVLLNFMVERYGTLYPLGLSDEFHPGWWLEKVQGTAYENALGRELAEGNKDGGTAQAEIWQIVGVLRARRHLYGDNYATKIENSYESGKEQQEKKKSREMSLAQNGGQVMEALGGYLQKGNYASIVTAFRKMGEKGVGSDEMFHMFLYFYTQITKDKHGNHRLPPTQVSNEELKGLSTKMFQQTPYLYFLLLKDSTGLEALDRYLNSIDKNWHQMKWDFNAKNVPIPSNDKLYSAFTLEKGDFRLLKGYAKAASSESTKIDNYVAFIQKIQVPTPEKFIVADDDVMMWPNNPLIYFNPKVAAAFIYRNLRGGGFNDKDHSEQYIKSLLNNLETLANAKEEQVPREDRDAFLKLYKAIFYREIYTHFDFKTNADKTGESRFRGTMADNINDDGEEAEKRDWFMENYYPKLRSIGFTVKECAEAAGATEEFKESHEKEWFRDARPYLVRRLVNGSQPTNNFRDNIVQFPGQQSGGQYADQRSRAAS